jgi:hypothetical protein
MKHLKTYIECDAGITATPTNTMGMGNPGEIAPDTLSEPIGGTAKSEVEKKKKKKKMKSLAESLFDIDNNVTNDLTFGGTFKLVNIETKDSLSRPGHGQTRGRMVKMKSKPEDMYKVSLISKHSGLKVNKDMESIAAALAVIVEKIPFTAESIKMSLYDFSQTTLKPLKQYYSSNVGAGYLSMGADVYAHTPDWKRDVDVLDAHEVDIDFLNIKLHYVKK